MKKKNLLLTFLLAALILGGGYNMMAAYTTNYNEVDVNGNTIYYYVGGYAPNLYAYVTYATSSYNSYSGNVVIPQTVTTNDKTYTVKYIDEAAFKNSTGLTSVTLPSSIIQIYKNAFEGCSALTSINLGETSVTSIGNYAFKGCTGLESITIPATTTSLGTNVFEGCTGLESITIPSLVTSIGSYTFDGCTSLTTVTINSNLTSIPSYLFRGCTSLSSVNIPSTVTSINGSAFYNCSALTSITIPAGVTSIGYQAFNGCTSLANVTYNATSCGDFSGAVFNASTADVFTVTMGDNVTRLPNNIFSGLTHLESITIPSSVTSIGNNAFHSCSGLASITIPSSVTSIGNTTFYGCSSLSSITIPASVTSIGANAFQNCTGLTEINYNVITHDDFTESTRPFKGCATNNITVTIGFGVEKIPAYLFYGTKAVGSVTIPGSVNNIGIKSFANTGGNYTSLTTVYMMGTTAPELADATIFKSGYSSYCTIKVLYSENHSILTDYQGAEYWSTFSSNISETNKFTVTNMDLTGITSPVTIPAGNTITITGTATNSTAANLVIEDGAQFVCNNNVAATMSRTITPFESANDEGHWYLIASPMTDEYLLSESSLISSTPANYDLYILDQNYDNQEWRNYKQGHFSHIKNKMGYLYASAVNTDVTFSGTLNNTDGEIDLTYVDGHDKTGFNLIGNPYPCNTTIGRDFYRIVDNNGVSELQLASGVIYPMEGVVVEASSNTDKVTFEKALPSSTPNNNDTQSALGINLSQDRGTLDRAIIRFGEGNNLSKMMLHPDNTRIYLEVEDKDYAVACSDGQGEMPVNFKAAKDGQYTISVSTENVEMGYLHLVDNKTNADIDLLSTPSYSFNAKSDDNASRFRLVFKANAVNDITTEGNEFAFLSNGQLIITNEGEATLQVIDITGRMLSTEVISGNYSKALNAAGVYVLRLINGETTKTQKIVVK